MSKLLKNKKLTDWLVLPIWYLLDMFVKKQDNYWGFPVNYADSKKFIENTRAVFEYIKADPEIKKVIFCRDGFVDFGIDQAQNVEYVQLQSFRGMVMLMKCKVLFLANAISWDFTIRWNNNAVFSIVKINLKKRVVVNVFHGIPLKKIFSLWNPELRKRYDRVKYRAYERENYTFLTASSKVDSYVMASCFYPIDNERVLPTGLPRNDFLLQSINELPTYVTNQIQAIKNIKDNKKFILYAPTHRQTGAVEGSGYYEFTDEEVVQLRKMLVANNAFLGVRMHYLRKGTEMFPAEKLIDNELIFDVGNKVVPEIAPLIREADLIVTDYSSLYIDALYIDRPVFSFAYDLEHYRDSQDGLVYDIEFAFPGPVVKTFSDLMQALVSEMSHPNQTQTEKYQMVRTMFFDNIDTNNSKRIVDFVQQKLKS